MSNKSTTVIPSDDSSELAERPKVTIKHDDSGWLITCGHLELGASSENMLATLCGTLMQDVIVQRKELRRLEDDRNEAYTQNKIMRCEEGKLKRHIEGLELAVKTKPMHDQMDEEELDDDYDY